METTPAPQRRLTRRQQEVLAFVTDFVDRQGFAPTVAEIAAGLDLRSPSGVHRILGALEQKGYLTRQAGRSRAITLRTPTAAPIADGSAEGLLLAVMRSTHGAARDRSLRMAAASPDSTRKSALIRDATDRHEFVVRYLPTTSGPAASGAADDDVAFASVAAMVQEMGTALDWPTFVVDQFVFNQATMIPVESLVERYPKLEAPLREVQAIARRSQAHVVPWLEEIGAQQDAATVEGLERRAAMMRHLSDVSGRLIEEHIAGSVDLAAPWSESPLQQFLGRNPAGT